MRLELLRGPPCLEHEPPRGNRIEEQRGDRDGALLRQVRSHAAGGDELVDDVLCGERALLLDGGVERSGLRVTVGGHDVLARAAYGGRPGHPVLLGRGHWAGVRAVAVGDAGARGYLAGRADVVLVECGDLADADDVDTPESLARFTVRG